ncbi:hypothetical protein MRX96_048499 [Rhipicephalus microplus]
MFAFGVRQVRPVPVPTVSSPGPLSRAKLVKVTKLKLQEMQHCRDTDLHRCVLLKAVLRNARSSTPTAHRKERRSTSRCRAKKESTKLRPPPTRKRAAEFKFTMPDRAKE